MFKSLRLHLRRTLVRRNYARRNVLVAFGRTARNRRSIRSTSTTKPVLPTPANSSLIIKMGEQIHREMERKIRKADGDARAIANAKLVAKNKLKGVETYAQQLQMHEALNPGLFGPVDLKVMQLQLREKYGSSKRKKRKSAKKGKPLQYKMQYYKGIRDGGVRTRNFRINTVNEESFNDVHWSESEVNWLLGSLVEHSFKEAFTFGRMESARVAEIMAWVNRRFDDHPLSFDSCCKFAGLQADDLRELFVKECKQHFGTDFPHYQVLRNGVIDAEYGNEDAIEWVLSAASTPMSFVDCCTALGFDPAKARAQILLPIVNHDHDQDSIESSELQDGAATTDDDMFGSFKTIAA